LGLFSKLRSVAVSQAEEVERIDDELVLAGVAEQREDWQQLPFAELNREEEDPS
jgi:hypothetical protein